RPGRARSHRIDGARRRNPAAGGFQERRSSRHFGGRTFMPRTNVVLLASLQTVATLLAVAATAAHATTPPAIRKPLGVYAKVDILNAINGYPGPGTPTPDELHTYLRGVYANLLADPAIAGLTIGEHWDRMEANPGPHGYDWSFLDDAFAT